jgi:alkylation response protein AidB-like acyl-CoA dehydrogenase
MKLNQMIAGDMTGNVRIKFTDVRVPESSLVGKINKASKSLVNTASAEKLIHFYGLLGFSQKLYEAIRDYAKKRIQGGKPIIEHPNIGAMIAEAAVNLEATRALMYRAAWEYNKGEKTTGSVFLNPLWGCFCNYYYKKMALRLCEIGAEVYAGVGTLKEMPLESYVRYLYGMLAGGSTPNMNLIKCIPYL